MKRRIFTLRQLIVLAGLLGLYSWQHLLAQSVNITPPNSTGNEKFGYSVTVLTNGNFVVTDPYYDEGGLTDIGAVYLYRGTTKALISTLKGSSAGDMAGQGGITVLANGNFVVKTLSWKNGSNASAGAATWCNGTTGLNGSINATNSLVGSSANDVVGRNITPLPNGSYIVCSLNWKNGTNANAGAITWGSGTAGVSGVVSAANSLISASASTYIGNSQVLVLPNSSCVVNSINWSNGANANAGAATWFSGTSAVTGVMSSANSLVGTNSNDRVGYFITALTNGNYVVGCYNWGNNGNTYAGAVTLCNGTTGTTGVVSAANSLVGANTNDQISRGRIWPLSNGNYIVCSPDWSGAKGAVTLCSGTTPTTGIVSTSNSFVGVNTSDQVGINGITDLKNSYYVVTSSYWKNGVNANAGAVTRFSYTAPTTGTISSANSLIGLNANDYVGSGGVVLLTNGNYVVSSPNWNNGSNTYTGAVTWFSSSATLTGSISAANSLTGTSANDRVGGSGVFALSNGNYIVASTGWSNGGSTSNAGAVTWGNGSTGLTGNVSAANSLVGAAANDYVGANALVLTNGNYVVRSNSYSGSTVAYAGAVTWCSGTTGRTGFVTSSNSLVGSSANDYVGSGKLLALNNGNYVIGSQNWSNGSLTSVGATTWADGTIGVSGTISATNSLIGSSAYDQVGNYNITVLTNNNYVINNQSWTNGGASYAGAITTGKSNAGLTGVINSCNSILGTVSNGGSSMNSVYNDVADFLLVGKPSENVVSIQTPFRQGMAENSDQGVATLNENYNAMIPLINSSACRIIAAIKPAGGSPVSGTVTANGFLRSTAQIFNGQALVRRTYDITPATSVNTATATVTLYYNQSDFDDYNTNRGSSPMLPTGPGDAVGIANLRINQQHGTSAYGTPGSYTDWSGSGPASIVIDPADANIVWNSSLSRWEVTFDITGFSGFFAFSGTGVLLPVKWLEINAALKESSKTEVSWKVQEQQVVSYTVERSIDGSHFTAVQTVATKGNGTNTYNLTDAAAFAAGNKVVYYRIAQQDADGKVNYSKLVSITASGKQPALMVYPAPFHSSFVINSGSVQHCSITDNTGRTMAALHLAVGTNVIQAEDWPAGTYYLKTANGESSKIVKQ